MAGNGDTLFATPLIHELRANFPEATIDALVRWPPARSLLEGNPHLNHVYQKDLIQASKLEGLKFLSQLRRQRYDISINTHPQSKIHYRVTARFINATQRFSHQYDNASIWDRWLVNRTLPQDYQRHAIENNLACLACLGAKQLLSRHDYELYLSPAELTWSDQFIASQNLAERKLLGLHVGSGGTKNLALRRWPLEHFQELIKRLNRARPGLVVLLFGGPDEEKDHAKLLAEAADRRSLFQPRTRNLREAAALVSKCDLFLSVNTVLMHLAAAMKVPKQIVIETPTWNKPIEPYNNFFILVPNPAVAGRNLEYYRYDGRGIQGSAAELTRCMAAVPVEAVFQTVLEALG